MLSRNTPTNMMNRNKKNQNQNKNKIQTRRNSNNKKNNANSSGFDANMGNISNAELNKILAGNNEITPNSGINQPMANNSLAAVGNMPLTTDSITSATNNLGATDFKITYMTPDGEKMRVDMETPMTMENTAERPYIKLGESLTSELKSGKQFILVMYDINAVGGTFIHMVVLYSAKMMRGVMKVKYFPPTPPAGTGNHKYIFELLEYVEKYDKNEEVAAYFSSLATERTLKKLESETPEIATKTAESGDINSFYEKVGVSSSGKIKSMIVSAS